MIVSVDQNAAKELWKEKYAKITHWSRTDEYVKQFLSEKFSTTVLRTKFFMIAQFQWHVIKVSNRKAVDLLK